MSDMIKQKRLRMANLRAEIGQLNELLEKVNEGSELYFTYTERLDKAKTKLEELRGN